MLITLVQSLHDSEYLNWVADISSKDLLEHVDVFEIETHCGLHEDL